MGQTNSMNVRVQHKHDIEANWLLATTFAPKAGELIIYDIDDNHSTPRFKVGDGTTLVANLPFVVGELTSELQEAESTVFEYVDYNDYTATEIQTLWDSVVV